MDGNYGTRSNNVKQSPKETGYIAPRERCATTPALPDGACCQFYRQGACTSSSCKLSHKVSDSKKLFNY